MIVGPWLPGYGRQNDSSMVVHRMLTGQAEEVRRCRHSSWPYILPSLCLALHPVIALLGRVSCNCDLFAECVPWVAPFVSAAVLKSKRIAGGGFLFFFGGGL